jgi:hypothetical protein
MIPISSELNKIVTNKSKSWKWKLHDIDEPRGSGDLEDEWCDYLRDDLGVIVDYCDKITVYPNGDWINEDEETCQRWISRAFELLDGKGGVFLDESKNKPHDQFLACLNPRNPDPENYFSILIFPKEVAQKILVLGYMPEHVNLKKIV